MTMKTILRKGRIAGPVYGLKASTAEGDPPGTFEAIVSVFGNVDYAGERVVAGAFASTLAAWKASGDPVPVIFSHQWDNLDAHIGEVLDAEELLPGDDRLPIEIRANGGLWTKFALDLEEEFAARVARKLEKRTLREFSFAYDVLSDRKAADGATDLLVLDLIEIGPTLKGMNSATALLSRARKALGAKAEGLTDDEVLEAIVDGATVEAPESADGDGAKAWLTLSGSVEGLQEAVFEAASTWARDADLGDGGFYYAYLEATFPEEARAVVLVEGWNDPVGEGTYYELDFAVAADGTVAVANPREVALEVSTVAKSRALKFRARPGSPVGAKAGGTLTIDDHSGKGNGNGAHASEDPPSRTESDGEPLSGLKAREALDLALLGAGLEPTDTDPR